MNLFIHRQPANDFADVTCESQLEVAVTFCRYRGAWKAHTHL